MLFGFVVFEWRMTVDGMLADEVPGSDGVGRVAALVMTEDV